jgi:hypothetical protein
MSCSKTNLWIKLNYVFVLALKNCYRVIDQNRRCNEYKLGFACQGEVATYRVTTNLVDTHRESWTKSAVSHAMRSCETGHRIKILIPSQLRGPVVPDDKRLLR